MAFRLLLEVALEISQGLTSNLTIAWQYAKVECIPPMTSGIFHGPVGDKLETAVSGFANGFVRAIDTKIKDMDAEVERKIREKEDALRAVQEKAKADELEKRKKAKDAKDAAEKKAAEAKKAPPKEEKKSDEPKK